MKPRIYSKDFKYTRAAETDIRKTFNRVRREQKCSTTAAPKSADGKWLKPVKKSA